MQIHKKLTPFSLPIGNHRFSYGRSTVLYAAKNNELIGFTYDWLKLDWLRFLGILNTSVFVGSAEIKTYSGSRKTKVELYRYTMKKMPHAERVRRDGWEKVGRIVDNYMGEHEKFWEYLDANENKYCKLLASFVLSSGIDPKDIYYDGLSSEWLYDEMTDRILPVDPFDCYLVDGES